jgi:hypothetical protein
MALRLPVAITVALVLVAALAESLWTPAGVAAVTFRSALSPRQISYPGSQRALPHLLTWVGD